MKKYVLKRLLSLIPTIFIVSVVIFLLVHLTPGDPAAAMLYWGNPRGAASRPRKGVPPLTLSRD